MNTTKLRSKRVLVTTAAVAVLAAGGAGVWATTASADEVSGGDRDRVAAAAVKAAGGGTATEVETSDDPGEAYEVEVRREDGTEVDVTLDTNLKVLATETDAPDETAAAPASAPAGADRSPGTGPSPDAGDRVLTPAEQASAEKAALAAVPGGTVVDVDASDDPGVAYEVEVRAADTTEWNVDLDSAFAVVTKTPDN